MSRAPPARSSRDLAEIEEIERRAYPTPWSRIDVRRRDREADRRSASAPSTDDRLVGYLIVSRYVDAWHVMNLAVPATAGAGIASTLLERLFDGTAGDGERGYTLEVRVSNDGAIRLYERLGFRPTRHPARLLHGQPRGRPDHVARPGRRAEHRRRTS